MKKFILSILIAVSATTLTAQNTTTRFFTTYNKETLTVSSVALGFTASKIVPTSGLPAQYVLFTVNCASGTSCVLRFSTNGTDPTTSTGLRAPYGTTVMIYGNLDIGHFKGIRETSTDVLLDIQYAR